MTPAWSDTSDLPLVQVRSSLVFSPSSFANTGLPVVRLAALVDSVFARAGAARRSWRVTWKGVTGAMVRQVKGVAGAMLMQLGRNAW